MRQERLAAPTDPSLHFDNAPETAEIAYLLGIAYTLNGTVDIFPAVIFHQSPG